MTTYDVKRKLTVINEYSPVILQKKGDRLKWAMIWYGVRLKNEIEQKDRAFSGATPPPPPEYKVSSLLEIRLNGKRYGPKKKLGKSLWNSSGP